MEYMKEKSKEHLMDCEKEYVSVLSTVLYLDLKSVETTEPARVPMLGL